MKMKKFGGTEKVVYDLVKPIADEQGYSIWDVSFEKEGAYWYLRVFIDHPDGIDIEDCEKMTRPVNAAVDAADPISQAYVLEVGRSGTGTEPAAALCRNAGHGGSCPCHSPDQRGKGMDRHSDRV